MCSPQFQYFIVDLFHSPYNYLWPVAQLDFFVNDLSNLKQANSFSLVWILSCIFKTLQCVNDMPHLVQEYGFSAPRILWWVLKQLLCTNHLSHFEQTNVFSPVWVIHDLFNYPLLEITCHIWNRKWLVSCVGPFMFFFKLVLCENDMSHLVQANGLSSVWVM